MKLRNKIFLCIFFLIAGCTDFLQMDPQGELTQASFPSSPSDALQATNAVYAAVRNWYYNSGGYPVLDIMSDDAYKGSNTNDQLSTVGAYDNFTFSSTGDGLDRWWATLYQGIKWANVVIEKVETVSMDTTLRNRYVGEARFLRGIFYFDLVRAWGGVPEVTTSLPPLHLGRATSEEIYSLIVSDLHYAETHLAKKSELISSDRGRATAGAADALLAKVYLFQKDFVNAEQYALKVIQSNEYSLESRFIDADGVNGNNGVESIFEVGALGVEDFNGGGAQYANTQGVRGSPNRGWGFNRPSIDLRKSFEPGDTRLKGTIIDLGDTIDGVFIKGDPDPANDPVITLNQDGDTINIQCYNRKVWTPGNDTPTQWAHHRRLIRYADVLLMAAEALNENGKQADALIYLNQVRKRARGGNISILPDVSITDKNLLRNKILLERRHELAMEGERFWDLVRTGKATAVLGPLGFVPGKHELLPIHQSEIDISQGSLKQNPNY
ncbi:MAG: RagB/SusD family nutrient uptake outer membrane protein [Bacteroidetes bacterium]|nr:MAG: RagB/SusD family nutrient uptake outer membrane protein [Bacteroidota bacterium]